MHVHCVSLCVHVRCNAAANETDTQNMVFSVFTTLNERYFFFHSFKKIYTHSFRSLNLVNMAKYQKPMVWRRRRQQRRVLLIDSSKMHRLLVHLLFLLWSKGKRGVNGIIQQSTKVWTKINNHHKECVFASHLSKVSHRKVNKTCVDAITCSTLSVSESHSVVCDGRRSSGQLQISHWNIWRNHFLQMFRRNIFPRIINLSTFNNIEIDIHLAELTLLTQSAHLLLYWLIWNGVKAKFTLINSFTFVVIEMKIENFITCAEIWLNLAIKRMIWNCISLLRRKLATTNTWITTSSSMHSRISVSSKPTITLHDHVMSEKFASSSDKNKYTISRF